MNELKSYTEYAVSTPTADFVIGFDFNYGEDAVNVTVDDVPATEAGYTVVYLNETTIRLSPSVPSGVVRLQRETDIDQTDNAYRAGAKFIAQTMDENFEQLRHSQQEVRDGFVKLADDTYEIIDTLEEVGQSAQDAADAAEVAAALANNAAAQVNDKVSYTDFNNKPHNAMLARDAASAHPTSSILDASGETQQRLNEGIESIAALRLLNPARKGLRVYVKSHTADTGKGGGWFVATQESGLVDDDGLIISSINPLIFWCRIVDNNTYQPEFWGAVGEAEALGFDDYLAFNKMFNSLSPARKTNQQTWSQVRIGLTTKPKKVLLTSLYKHSKTLYIPPFIKFTQEVPFDSTHVPKTQIGLWYEPVAGEYDTCAVSNYVYKRDTATGAGSSSSKWDFNTDIYYLPDASDIDFNYFGLPIDTSELTVITNDNVTLGVRVVNAIPTYTIRDLSIGGKVGDHLSYNFNKAPKVGLLHHSTYVTKYDSLRVVAGIQGVVISQANASVALDQPWIVSARKYPITTVPIYKQVNDSSIYTQNGTVGITLFGECHLFKPTYENWNIGIAAIDVKFLRVDRPHAESLYGLYEFYLQNCKAHITSKSHFGSMCVPSFTDVDGTTVTQTDTFSALYLKDLNNPIQHYVKVDGHHEYGDRLVRGENSGKVVEFNYSRCHVVAYFGQLGDSSLVRSFNTTLYDTIYVDPVTGDDKNLGLTTSKPVKTYIEALKRYDFVGNIKTLSFMNATEITGLANFDLVRDLTITGTKAVNLSIAANSAINPNFKNSKVTLTNLLTINAVNYVFKLGYYSTGAIDCFANFTTEYFAFTDSYCDVDMLINNTTASCTRFFQGNEAVGSNIEQAISLNVRTSSALPLRAFGNNNKVILKYASSNIAYVKVAYDPSSIPAGQTTTTTVMVYGANVGDLVAAAFSQYNADIEISAVVSAANTVTVKFKNTGTVAVDLASGTLVVKKI